MIKCDKGKVEIEGKKEIIIAEFATMIASFREDVLLPRYQNEDIADSELRSRVEEVIQYCRVEKNMKILREKVTSAWHDLQSTELSDSDRKRFTDWIINLFLEDK